MNLSDVAGLNHLLFDILDFALTWIKVRLIPFDCRLLGSCYN